MLKDKMESIKLANQAAQQNSSVSQAQRQGSLVTLLSQ